MAYTYDQSNIFARILRGEIPSSFIYESTHSVAFRDIRPQAPEHVLVIPRGPYVNFDHFAEAASSEEITDFTRAVAVVSRQLGVTPDEGAGYRLIANSGDHAHQEVPHLHFHILAGRALGPMLTRV
jgi:histidine triad (HIT) family protein